MKKKKNGSYLESFKEYQNKMYIPGYFIGGKIHPSLRAKTKVGGYGMVIAGTFLFTFYLLQLVTKFSIESIVWLLIPIAFSTLLILVGVKFIRINSNK